jgi:hypothetical protein
MTVKATREFQDVTGGNMSNKLLSTFLDCFLNKKNGLKRNLCNQHICVQIGGERTLEDGGVGITVKQAESALHRGCNRGVKSDVSLIIRPHRIPSLHQG